MRIEATERYLRRLKSIRDPPTRARILFRVDRLIHGNSGECKAVGSGMFELCIDFGPGYRIYYVHHAGTYLLLLVGGSKATQDKDIRQAVAMARNLKEGRRSRPLDAKRKHFPTTSPSIRAHRRRCPPISMRG